VSTDPTRSIEALAERRSQQIVELRALRAAGLVHAGLEVEEAEQAPVLDVAGAALVAGAGVLVFHDSVTVSTSLLPSKGVRA
jgi:hypothetical protein